MKKPRRLDCRAFHPRFEVYFLDEVTPADTAAVLRFVGQKVDLTFHDIEELDLRTAHGLAYRPADSRVVIVQIEKGLKGVERLTTLSHEAIHVAGYIFSHIGQPPSWDHDEVFARLHDHIFTQMLEAA